MSLSYIDPDKRKICVPTSNNPNVQVKVEPKIYFPNNTSIDPPKICGKFFLANFRGGEGAMGVQLNLESTTNIIFFYILQ